MYTHIRAESQRDAGVFSRGGQGRAFEAGSNSSALDTNRKLPARRSERRRIQRTKLPAAHSPESCSCPPSLNTAFVSESIDAEDQTGFRTSRFGASGGELQPRL